MSTTIEIYDKNGILQTGATAAAGSFAPTTSKYLVQQADAALPNAQVMGALGTGLVKNTTTTGVQSIAAAGTDYTSPTGTEGLSNKTITASSIVATAISLLIGGFKAIFTHANTVDRTYTLPDYDATLATVAGTETLANKTLTTPTIGNFTNANHDHSNAANGGGLPAGSISSGQLSQARGGTGTDLSADDGFIRVVGGVAYPYKWNFIGAASPGITDDINAGYKPGSMWLDTTNIRAFICISNTAGAAVWLDVTFRQTDVAHNSTTGLQGGTVGERYHLTQAQQLLLAQNQAINVVLAGPASGGAGAPAYRALVADDLPVMVGDSGAGGSKGAAPAPAAGDTAAGKYLKADGTWAVPPGSGSVPPSLKVYQATTFV